MDSSYAVGFTIFMLLNIFQPKGVVNSATITLQNNCSQTVWPASTSTLTLDSTGFELPKGASRDFQGPTGWAVIFWGRTGCTFNESGHGSCSTGDCGSGQLECNGAIASAATQAEFTLGSRSIDYYVVSLVDGYNLPLMIDVMNGSGQCASTGCVEDLNQRCPLELRIEGGGACRSACNAFGKPEYCCTGDYGSGSSCRPSKYSQLFKSTCPSAHSYPFDDATSMFTCEAANYVVTFCPSHSGHKPPKSGNVSTTPGSRSGSGSVNVTEDGRMADPAAGDSTRRHSFGVTIQILTLVIGLVHFAIEVPLL